MSQRYGCWLIVGLVLPLAALIAQTPETSSSSALAFYRLGQERLLDEDWYGAAEAFLEALRINPRYADPAAGLAECYFVLAEYDQALSWVRKARVLKSGNIDLANLEASILIAKGNLTEADVILAGVFKKEPYNKDALFAAAELDLARGRIGEATLRYRAAVQRYPDDRNALLSLALVLGSLGEFSQARSFANRAVKAHPEDYMTLFYSAYLEAMADDLTAALATLRRCLVLNPDYRPALALLAPVYYRSGAWDDAARIADLIIDKNRMDVSAWYLKALAFIQLGRAEEARKLLSAALAVDASDEFVRALWEKLLLADTEMESPERGPAASFHFAKAAEFQERNLIDQALFEYRRGLRLNPYAIERTSFANLLGSLGYPARQLSELRFIQELGKANRTVDDAVEAYDSILADALHRRWNVDADYLDKRHWSIAVTSLSGGNGSHADASQVAAEIVKEYLVHDGSIAIMAIPEKLVSFADAFKAARSVGADYFFIVRAKEGIRDIALDAGLYVGRTGSLAADFTVFRTGDDRLRAAARRIVDSLNTSLPFRAKLIVRKAGQGIIDKGRIDGLENGRSFDIVMKESLQPLAEGIGLAYSADNILGKFTVNEVDEEIALGSIVRTGFYDKITEGDEIVAAVELAPATTLPPNNTDPELQRLLRSLR